MQVKSHGIVGGQIAAAGDLERRDVGISSITFIEGDRNGRALGSIYNGFCSAICISDKFKNVQSYDLTINI